VYVRETTDREVHSLATAHSEELNQLRQQHLEQLEASRQRWETERAELKLVTDRTVLDLQAKLSSLDQSYSGSFPNSSFFLTVVVRRAVQGEAGARVSSQATELRVGKDSS
jgi:hypothetical protein